ncbi:MAG: acyl-CoA thioesterase [Burkholderiales bacterium]|nr:acyl-CoA thioesterase [Opitutaceae bacterium]
MPFHYARTIRFADTDAAGIVYFARYLSICHEAYEEALAVAGINLATFFADTDLVIPIAKSEASYLRPLACGEKIRVDVTPARLSDNSFALDFVVWKTDAAGPAKRACVARTEHVCIHSQTRERQTLPANLAAWVDAG